MTMKMTRTKIRADRLFDPWAPDNDSDLRTVILNKLSKSNNGKSHIWLNYRSYFAESPSQFVLIVFWVTLNYAGACQNHWISRKYAAYSMPHETKTKNKGTWFINEIYFIQIELYLAWNVFLDCLRISDRRLYPSGWSKYDDFFSVISRRSSIDSKTLRLFSSWNLLEHSVRTTFPSYVAKSLSSNFRFCSLVMGSPFLNINGIKYIIQSISVSKNLPNQIFYNEFCLSSIVWKIIFSFGTHINVFSIDGNICFRLKICNCDTGNISFGFNWLILVLNSF